MIASSTTAADHRKDPPPLYPSAAGLRIAPPTLREAGYVLKLDSTVRVSARREARLRTSDSDAVPRAVRRSARECLELAEKIRAAHSGDDDSDAEGYETDTIDDALDDDEMTHTAMSRLRLFHQPKLFTSPPTSCASQPSPRHPSWSEKTRPRSIGKRRCLYSGQRISTTYSQTILLVRELGQKLKQRCIDW